MTTCNSLCGRGSSAPGARASEHVRAACCGRLCDFGAVALAGLAVGLAHGRKSSSFCALRGPNDHDSPRGFGSPVDRSWRDRSFSDLEEYTASDPIRQPNPLQIPTFTAHSAKKYVLPNSARRTSWQETALTCWRAWRRARRVVRPRPLRPSWPRSRPLRPQPGRGNC